MPDVDASGGMHRAARATALAVLLGLTACASPRGTLSPVADTVPGASKVDMLVATTRMPRRRSEGILLGQSRAPALLCRIHRVHPARGEPQAGRGAVAAERARQSGHRFRDPEGGRDRPRPGDGMVPPHGAHRAQAPRAGVHPRLQQPLRRCGLPLRADRARCRNARGPGAVHLALARQRPGLWLRPREQHLFAQRARNDPARHRPRPRCGRDLDPGAFHGQLGHAGGPAPDGDPRRPGRAQDQERAAGRTGRGCRPLPRGDRRHGQGASRLHPLRLAGRPRARHFPPPLGRFRAPRRHRSRAGALPHATWRNRASRC